MTQHLETTGAIASSARLDEAKRLMEAFAHRTGLGTAGPGDSSRRYLWTDAFAVCNFLGLAARTGEARYAQLAVQLVDRVHEILGRHRPDSGRSGWLSELDEAQGRRHPTRGGLRIGKARPERGPDEPFDAQLEWDRDGQYFHYLTRWMHALDQVARFTHRAHYNLWARELADAAHAAFTQHDGDRRPRMVWKMSCDLSRVQVSSMGLHDPLDGLITALELQATARVVGNAPAQPTLEQAVSDYAAMLEVRGMATADPLGIGGLLIDAARLEQLGLPPGSQLEGLLRAMLAAAQMGLEHLAGTQWLDVPAERRLAFRELGLAIGLAAVSRLDHHAGADWSPIARFADTGNRISEFWLDVANRRAENFTSHLDISEVMLAASLIPDATLRIAAL